MYDSAITELRPRADVRLQWSAVVAKPKKQKADSGQSRKVRVTFTVDLVLYRRFRLTAAQLDMTESQLQELLMSQNVGSAHARGINEKLAAAAGQGSGSDDCVEIDQGANSTGPTVRINRIADIARRSTAPVDQSIDDLTNEPA